MLLLLQVFTCWKNCYSDTDDLVSQSFISVRISETSKLCDAANCAPGAVGFYLGTAVRMTSGTRLELTDPKLLLLGIGGCTDTDNRSRFNYRSSFLRTHDKSCEFMARSAGRPPKTIETLAGTTDGTVHLGLFTLYKSTIT